MWFTAEDDHQEAVSAECMLMLPSNRRRKACVRQCNSSAILALCPDVDLDMLSQMSPTLQMLNVRSVLRTSERRGFFIFSSLLVLLVVTLVLLRLHHWR